MSRGAITKARVPAPPVSNLMMSLASRYSSGKSAGTRGSEGYKLALNAVEVPDATGSSSVLLGADFSSVPSPTRRYAADIADVIVHKNDVLMIFGQEQVYSGGLDSVLQVRLNPRSAREFIKSLEDMGGPSLESVMTNIGVEPESLTPITSKPDKEAKVVANFATVAISGFEACMDFYHASPRSFRDFATSHELYVEPVTRVDLHTALFFELAVKLKQLESALPVSKEDYKNEQL